MYVCNCVCRCTWWKMGTCLSAHVNVSVQMYVGILTWACVYTCVMHECVLCVCALVESVCTRVCACMYMLGGQPEASLCHLLCPLTALPALQLTHGLGNRLFSSWSPCPGCVALPTMLEAEILFCGTHMKCLLLLAVLQPG
jgi:hypothetical protein